MLSQARSSATGGVVLAAAFTAFLVACQMSPSEGSDGSESSIEDSARVYSYEELDSAHRRLSKAASNNEWPLEAVSLRPDGLGLIVGLRTRQQSRSPEIEQAMRETAQVELWFRYGLMPSPQMPEVTP